MTKVRKAVIPVAGLGTRNLPAAKATPKNLLNVFDRPLLAYIVAEAWASGIEHLVLVLGRGQSTIEDYFDHAFELEAVLEAKGKVELLGMIRADLPCPGQLSFVRQMAPLGLGHAVWCAREVVGSEPFAVMLPDMLMEAQPAALAQAISAFGAVGGNIVVVEQAPAGEAHKYGIVALGEPATGFGGKLKAMTGMVEKPKPGTEPSNLFISGRYILQPEIFELLGEHRPGAGGEIQLTDAMAALRRNQRFHALEYDGTTFDCGDSIGLLRASLAMAVKHPQLGSQARLAARAIIGT